MKLKRSPYSATIFETKLPILFQSLCKPQNRCAGKVLIYDITEFLADLIAIGLSAAAISAVFKKRKVIDPYKTNP